ncbi:MAG TPA: redoxin family protein [Humisphaera sp.]
MTSTRLRRWSLVAAATAAIAAGGAYLKHRPAAAVAAESPSTRPAAEGVREGPAVLSARAARVGVMLPDLAFSDLAGKPHKLSDFRDRKAVVLCMTGTGCPLARKYLPTLGELEKAYAGRGVQFVLVNPQATESPESMRQAAADGGYAGLYAHDKDGSLAAAIGAASTTEAVVIDPARTVVYRGAVDDQYGLGFALPEPRRKLLVDALDAVLAGRSPDVAATTAPGCALDAKPAAAAPARAEVTYHNRISRIVQRSCLECHRAGENGPFELATYADVKDHLPMIRKVVQKGTMPPWHAAAATSAPFANDWSLPEQDKADLLAWAAAGAPEGDPKDAPLPRQFVQGWRIGKPDAVFAANREQEIPAKGPIRYRYAIADTKLTEDKWVSAVEIRCDQPQVVHHLLAFVIFPPGDARVKNYPDFKGGTGGYFAGLVPGQAASFFPEGTAKLLPKGAQILLQIHYTPNGKAVTDRPRIGFRFAAGPPKHEMLTVSAHTERFKIAPGDPNAEVTADYPFRAPARIYSFNPHSHVRGKAWRYELLFPDGRKQTVLDVPRYDFNWQLEYRLAEPIDVPAGAVLRATAWYDNSKDNPGNPDPTATVRFGEQTDQEMMIGYVTGHKL